MCSMDTSDLSAHRSEAVRTASAASFMCLGVVPQQPPTATTPNCDICWSLEAKYSGDERYSIRPFMLAGYPLFGIAIRRRPEPRERMSSSICAGPHIQLSPHISVTFAAASRSLR
jgi:hypothetical protein